MLRWTMLAWAAVLGGACMPMQANTPPREATSVNASFGQTYDATLLVLQRHNIPVDSADRAHGIIRTRQVGVAGPETVSWADCGRNGIGQSVQVDGGVYRVVIDGDSTASTVRVFAQWTSTLFGERSCESNDVWERIAEGEIRRLAENTAHPRPVAPRPSGGPS